MCVCCDGLVEWLDKQQGVGRLDDGCDAGLPASTATVSAAGGEDGPTPYAPLSSADDGNVCRSPRVLSVQSKVACVILIQITRSQLHVWLSE